MVEEEKKEEATHSSSRKLRLRRTSSIPIKRPFTDPAPATPIIDNYLKQQEQPQQPEQELIPKLILDKLTPYR